MKALQGEGELLKQFNVELAKASEFWLGMALVTKSGLDLISSSIERCLNKEGCGHVLFGIDLPTEPAAIELLCELHAQHKGVFEVRRFQSGKTFFHPKFSIFLRRGGAKTAIIGSSNLTGGGLNANYETNIFVDDPKVVQQLLDYFEEHFEGSHARPVGQRWLIQYQHLWIQRKKIEQIQRKLRDKARGLGTPPPKMPDRIEGHCFAFTGGILGWPREPKLYPFVAEHGGTVAKKAKSMGAAECLVHAEILGGKKSTQKLMKARQKNIPIITEEQFFRLARI